MTISNSLILLFLTLILSPHNSRAQEKKALNIILIMTDDQGWYDAGFNGNDAVSTPNLDALAAKGMILNRFYAASAVCSPTRASVQTGRNPLRTNVPYANHGYLLKEEITVAELLKEQGYATGHFGKWHLGTLTRKKIDANRGGREENHEAFNPPTYHGYDRFFCTESKVPTYDPMYKPQTFEQGESLRFGWVARGNDEDKIPYGTAYWNDVEQIVTEDLSGSNPQLIVNKVIDFIQFAEKKKQPFFSTIWFHTPHLPLVTSKDQLDMFSNYSLEDQLYLTNLYALDEQVGRLWRYLEDSGLADSTMLWFCSDNGPERNTPGSAGIFRGEKRYLYEGGIRVPSFVVWKGHVKSGSSSDFPMVTSDYLPTILSVLGIDYPSSRPLDGIDLSSVLRGEKKVRKAAIGFLAEKQEAWIGDRYKIVRMNQEADFELYDLLQDPGESKNLMNEESEVGKQMIRSFSSWKRSVQQSMTGADYQ